MNLGTIIDKDRVRRSFSRQAQVYEQNALLQKQVAQKLVSIALSKYKSNVSPLTVLDIGIGTGFATREISSAFSGIHAFGCDIAWGMLKEAAKTGAVLTEADAEHLPYKDETFDLAFSSLALQWTNLWTSINEAFRVLRPDGRFHFSTFGGKTLNELAESYDSASKLLGVGSMIKTMRFESVMMIKSTMESAGFEDVKVETDLIRNSFQSPEALLRSLKAIGAGNPSREFHPSRGLLQETFRIYRERYGDENGISATFEVVYASGEKK